MLLFNIIIFVAVLVTTDTTIEEPPKIVGGVDADIEEFPHQIAFRQFGAYKCGGSIYKENIVITAAHCFVHINSTEGLSIVAGFTLLSEAKEVAKVRKVIKHDKFDIGAQFNYDIAILILDRNLKFSSRIKPIPLAKTIPPVGSAVTITGWGVTEDNSGLSNHLQKVEVNIISQEKCQKLYEDEFVIFNNMICAGTKDGGKDSCRGDSGGPLVSENKLLGIVSFGLACGQMDAPGIYTSIPHMIDWIEENVEKHADSSE